MDILNDLKLSDLQFIEKLNLGPVFSQKELQDPQAVQEPVFFNLTPFNVDTQEVSPLTLVASVNLKHQIQLFNNLTEDIDQDHVVGNDATAFIKFDSNTPLLKYDIHLTANTGATVNTNGLKVGIKSGAHIKHFAYLKHQPTDTVQAAILKDVKSLPFIFSLAKIKNLQPGEALAFETNADFGFDLSFDPVDLLATGVSAISKYVKQGEAINLNVSASGSFGVSFSVKDNFELAFAKTNDGRFQVLVKKAKTSENTRSLGLQTKVAFAKPQQVAELVNSKIDELMAATTNLAPDKLWEVVQKLEAIANGSVPFGNLSPLERALIETLAKRLNIPEMANNALNAAKDLLAKIARVKTNLQQDIIEAAKTKFTAGFNYDYSYVSSNEVLIEAIISEAALTQAHKDLVLMNTQSLVAASTNKAEVELLTYINSKTTERHKTWGIVLGIGNYKLGGIDKQDFIRKITTNVKNGQEEQLASYKGVRGYTEQGSLGGNALKWWGGIDAQMPHAMVNPTMDLFDYGITIDFNHYEKKITHSDTNKVTELLDLASAWNIIDNTQLEAQSKQLLFELTKGGDAGKVNFSYKLNISPEAFNDMRATWLFLLQNKPEIHLQILSNAFGKAMPYSSDYAYRKDQNLRAQAYGSLWKAYFSNEGFSSSIKGYSYQDYAHTAEDALSKVDSVLAKAEGNYANNRVGDNMWFGGIIRMNSHCGTQMNRLVTGIQSLLENVQAKSPNYDKIISRAFQKIVPGFSQSFYAKALAPYFISMANNNPAILAEIAAVLEVTFTDDAQQLQTIILQKKS